MKVQHGEHIDHHIKGADEFRGRVDKWLLGVISDNTSKPVNIVNEAWDILYEGMRSDESGHIEV